MKHSITLAGVRTRGAESLAVKAGGLVFTSALNAAMRGGPARSVEEEAGAVLALAQDVLEALGSNLSSIAKLKGYLADIVGVEGNPLDDPQTLLRPRLVVKSGKIVRSP